MDNILILRYLQKQTRKMLIRTADWHFLSYTMDWRIFGYEEQA